jgi:predicted transcriptional regulator
MLSQILNAFKETTDPMDINELNRRLGTERSALEGMLDLLVKQGKLREIKPGSEECVYCRSRAACSHLKSGHLMGTVYELAKPKPDDVQN